jgi:alkanesulfonate monooxygenase SsuD/methylene tetrahydromethanopterin reductase-like flavin-dependent oxidoreductase (luciferase family)
MEIGLGIDSRFALTDDDQRTIAREAAALGYTSLWTPVGHTREPFDVCVTWHQSSGLPTGIAVAPVSAWPMDKLASVSKETLERTDGHFTLGIGVGRTANAPIRVMRQEIEALRVRLPDAVVFLGALGPQMLRLAGERYDGAALNWCTAEHVGWCRDRVAAGARAAGRDPADVRIHEYIRVCVDHDAEAARIALAKAVLGYALAAPGSDKTKSYRGHFTRMGFDDVITELESRRDSGATEDELARLCPAALLRRVGYAGPPSGAHEAFMRLADGLDIAIVRVVASRKNDLSALRTTMAACAPKS